MYKGFVTILLAIFAYFNSSAQSRVAATIKNFKNDNGVCRACLFDNAGAFTGEGGKPYECLVIPVKNKLAQVVFDNVKPGKYAMFVFHDANNNNKIDKNFIGIPKEGYGASRNKLPFAAAPKFDENKFEVQGSKQIAIAIELRHVL